MNRRSFLESLWLIPVISVYSCDKIKKTIEQRIKPAEIITIKADEDYFIDHYGGLINTGNFKGKKGYLDSLDGKQAIITPNPKKNLKIVFNKKFHGLISINVVHSYQNVYTIESIVTSPADSLAK